MSAPGAANRVPFSLDRSVPVLRPVSDTLPGLKTGSFSALPLPSYRFFGPGQCLWHLRMTRSPRDTILGRATPPGVTPRGLAHLSGESIPPSPSIPKHRAIPYDVAHFHHPPDHGLKPRGLRRGVGHHPLSYPSPTHQNGVNP
jgi:hypothetical protein